MLNEMGMVGCPPSADPPGLFFSSSLSFLLTPSPPETCQPTVALTLSCSPAANAWPAAEQGTWNEAAHFAVLFSSSLFKYKVFFLKDALRVS